jgi:hypothetical protein
MSGLNNSAKPVANNDDDKLLFEGLERNAIQHYPNPMRRGCPSEEVLQRFVKSPSEVSVHDLKDLHIFHCAECTLDLKRLREAREKRIANGRSSSLQVSKRLWIAVAAVLLIAAIVPAAWYFAHKQNISEEHVAKLVLRDINVERGAEAALVIPRSQVTLHIELIQGDLAGKYEVVLSKNRSMDSAPLRFVGAPDISSLGSHIDAHFNLQNVPVGGYWVGVKNITTGRVWYTFVLIE